MIVTVEEHSVIGGLGEAVSSAVCEEGVACGVVKIGVQDRFGVSGPAVEVLKAFGLDSENIVAVVKNAIKQFKS